MSDVEMEPYRYKAKAVGFGLLYGKATFSLANEWGVSVEEAQAVVDAIMGNSPEVAAWIESQHRFAYANGYVNTVIDGKPARWLPVYEARSPVESERRQGQRRAVNAPIQGSAADFMMRSLVATVDWLESDNVPAKIVATVHDSMLIEVEDAWAEDVARTTLSIMEQWDMGPVPLKADIEVGRSWGTLKKAKFMEGNLMFKDGDLWKPVSCLV
jgi:DNA polymerase-1